MAFIAEDVPDLGPAELADEHRRLVAWMKASRVGVVEYLKQRMVDPELPAAFYYVEGLGMGDGQRFALVRGDAIYLVSVYWGTRKAADEHAAVRVLVNADLNLTHFPS